MSVGKIVIYGGRGSLGSACVNYFRATKWWVGNVDVRANPKADFNITISPDASWTQQEEHVMTLLNTGLRTHKVEAIVCVAGGWVGGNVSQNFSRKADLMWRQSVISSSIAAVAASKYLCSGGLLALVGATPALKATPNMMGYGMAKAAVHQLTKSLGAENSGLPEQAAAVAILPLVIDTPMNRRMLPKADHTRWTPMSFVIELIDKWIHGQERPASGSLMALVTKDKNTQVLRVTENLEKSEVLIGPITETTH
ncbi:dihydropteridine reductase-like [Helicoverpa armigera]|uniref:dihydropteridine reductase-like n=1 Tax=Helicoverpa armigera TaxID=29058 RepID=UPI003082BDA8